jgi:hypothetical protein
VIFVRRAKNESSVSGDATPMAIAIRKQRHGTGSCCDITGWFHRPLRQFHSSQWVPQPTRYLPDAAYEP